MSTHAKLFTAAAILLGLGLLVGFFPIHVSTALSTGDCGSAFLSKADEFSEFGRDVCGGKIAMMRYPSIALIATGAILGIWGLIAQANSETWQPIR